MTLYSFPPEIITHILKLVLHFTPFLLPQQKTWYTVADMIRMERKLRPGQKLIFGFLGLIFLGGFLLFLPVSQIGEDSLSFLDSLFLSTSAICVTGLTPVDISQTLSTFGRIVLALLIQIGGLGYASFAVFFHVLLRQNVSFSQRNLAQEALNQETGKGIVGLVKFIASSSLVIEFTGTILLMIVFRDRFSSLSTLFGYGLFHSVSAFNNAGFDLFGNSMMDYSGNLLMNFTICALIILGGLGFFVMGDIISKKRWKRFSFHTKIVLSMTLFLIIAGTFLIKETGSGLSWLESYFLSVSSRTAGFNSVDTGSLSLLTVIVVMCLMWIGASPGSTGGGVKTTTFFTVLIALRAVITTKKECSAYHRKIAIDSILKAFSVLCLSLAALLVAIFALCACEGGNQSFVDLSFEAFSAMGTVGLSRGITGSLLSQSKIILMLLMFIGRLGPLTIVSSLSKTKNASIHCVEEHIIIG